jgi:hypothetical protein
MILNEIAKGLIKKMPRLFLSVLRRFDFREKWIIAYEDNGLIKRLPRRFNNWNADPFVAVSPNGQHKYLFFEEFLTYKQKGVISFIDMNNPKMIYPMICLEEKFHLSFPFIFWQEDELFMIPESSQNRDIRIYKFNFERAVWVFEKTLISDFEALDSMIIQVSKIFYIITTVPDASGFDRYSKLVIFSNKHLFSSNWSLENSVDLLFDCEGGRNAGFIQSVGKNQVLRCAQKSIGGRYGDGIMLFKIDFNSMKMSEFQFKPEEYFNIPFTQAIHHISRQNLITAWDSRSRTSPNEPHFGIKICRMISSFAARRGKSKFSNQ